MWRDKFGYGEWGWGSGLWPKKVQNVQLRISCSQVTERKLSWWDFHSFWSQTLSPSLRGKTGNQKMCSLLQSDVCKWIFKLLSNLYQRNTDILSNTKKDLKWNSAPLPLPGIHTHPSPTPYPSKPSPIFLQKDYGMPLDAGVETGSGRLSRGVETLLVMGKRSVYLCVRP